jgi:nucleotide-binding universal stress UspA family protein
LVLYHHNPQVYTGEIPVLYIDDLNQVNADIAKHLEHEIEKLTAEKPGEKPFPKVRVVVNTSVGTIPSIIEQAKSEDADLIVMGSHGKTGLSRLVFGSVTTGVLEVSPIPVLSVPEGYRYKIVDQIAYASSLQHFQAEWHQLKKFLGPQAVQVKVVNLQYPYSDQTHMHQAKHLLKTEGDDRVSLEVLETSPEIRLVDQLVVYCRKTDPDWLVMFPMRRDWFEKIILSSKTLELVTHFRRPLLVLHR